MEGLVTPSDYAEFFSLERVFITAFLLTGDTKRAEAVVLDAIEMLDFASAARHALLRLVVREAVTIFPTNTGSAAASTTLNPHFRKVVDLPRSMRQCFVLRFLVRLDRRECADMLRVEEATIDELAIEACRRLTSTRDLGSRCERCAATRQVGD